MSENSSSPSGEKKWFYHQNDQALGPYSIQDLKELAGSGKISPATWIGEAGAAEWKQLSSVLSTDSHEFPSTSSVSSQQQKPPQTKEGVTGCLILILICAIPTFLFFKCYGGDDRPKDGGTKTPVDHPTMKQVADSPKLASKFDYVIDGNDSIVIGDAVVEDLGELVGGIYGGTIPESDAKRCIVLDRAVSQSSFSFQNIAGDHLIYEASLTYHERFKFAVIRDAGFEKGGRGDDLIHYGDLVFVKREQFTTQGGLIISIPVFRAVNLNY